MTHPFDALAEGYDAAFTTRSLGRLLRAPVRRRLAAAFPPGHQVLELGCGTGDDAVWLARRDVRVTAVDASAAMLRVATGKVRQSATADRITLRQTDLATDPLPSADDPAELFDGAFSNFGGLNCLPDLRPLAEAVANRVRAQGRFLVVVMGRWCPWEIVGYGVRGRPVHAFRRIASRAQGTAERPGTMVRLGDGDPLRVWYHSPRSVRRAMAPWFRPVESIGVGVLLPPTDFSGLVDRWPRLFQTLASAEAQVAGTPPGVWLNDHHLTVFERR